MDVFWEKETRLFGFFGPRRWDLGGRLRVPYKYLAPPLKKISFLGEEFYAPNRTEAFLKRLYGRTWRTPIAGAPSKNGFLYQLKKLRKKPRKTLFYLNRYIRNHILKR